MKLITLLAIVTCAYSAKLDRTYLPPNHAQTSGGSGTFLQAPLSGSSDFSANGNGLPVNGNNYAQNGNNYARNGNGYAQNNNGYTQNANARSFDNGVSGFGNDYVQQPERAQAAFERNAAIVRLNNDNDGETYAYSYETENGITAEENGVATNGVEAQGGYSYTGDDGQVYSVRYTAGQNGFLPEGEHLPTAPPVPEEILRALEQNARDEAAGIYDDGSYDDGKYNGANEGYNYNANNAGFSNFVNNGNVNNNVPSFNNDDEDTVVTNAARYNMADNTQRIAFGNQANIPQGIRSQGNPSPRNFNDVSKAYLPPFANQGSGSRTSNGKTGFGARSRKPSFNSRTGYQY